MSIFITQICNYQSTCDGTQFSISDVLKWLNKGLFQVHTASL